MKKHNLLVFALLWLMMSCTEDKVVTSDGKGSLYILSKVVDVEIFSRAVADVNQFTLILEHETDPEGNVSGLFSNFPDGVVDHLPAGKYTLELTSHPDGFVPAFEDPWYQGLASQVLVASDKTTMVTVECTQANAGIMFMYDPSLEAIGLGDIVPEMRQGNTTLYFEGENRESKAYFMPGEVELRIKQGDTYLSIGGQESQTLTVGKEQLWQATLKASQITGKLGIIATVKVITDPTNFIEFILGEGADPVTVQELEITAHTASFLAKGQEIEAVRFGVFETASVDFMLNTGTTLEDIMDKNGTDMPANYLAQLNGEEGLILNFDGMQGKTAYTFLLMPTKNSVKKAQRYDFVTAEGIAVDPVQDPNGPIVPGAYTLNIYQEEVDGIYGNPYENEILIQKAVQDNLYIVSNLFLIGDLDLVAEYDENKGRLTFTGKDISGYDIFNETAFVFNSGQYYAGIYLTDGTGPVEKLVFNVADRKLSTVPVVMELRLFDPMTEEYLGWLEISPLNNPLTYGGSIAEAGWNNMALPRTISMKSSSARPASQSVSSAKGYKVIHASVSVLR